MKSFNYPTEPSPNKYIDVIIPFHSLDAHFLGECLTAIAKSTNIIPIIHVVADGCLFPNQVLFNNGFDEYEFNSSQSPNCRKYFTAAGTGCYRIINALVANNHLKTPFFAIQDVDDLSHPDRLWKQVSVLSCFHMTTCAMKQQPSQGYKGVRHVAEPVIFPGKRFSTTPYGRVVNGTRVMRLSTFKELNGFQDMFCSGDFQFDNRILPLYDCHCSLEVLATRRLHPTSISNGREQVYPNMNRASFVNEIKKAIKVMKTKTIESARSLGALNRPVEITKI